MAKLAGAGWGRETAGRCLYARQGLPGRAGTGEEVLVAIDKYLIPRHSRDNMMHLARSKPKDGTSKLECYATMQVVAEPVAAVLECVQVTRDVFDTDFVRNFIGSCFTSRCSCATCGLWSGAVQTRVTAG